MGNKDREIAQDQVGGSEAGQKSVTVSACGRSDSPSGVEGFFNIVDTFNGTKIRSFYFNSPWGVVGSNTWTVSGSNDDWSVDSSGTNDSGALGTITVEVSKSS